MIGNTLPQKKLQRLSPQAKEALAKRYKIGKYRDWVFSPERLAEITLKFEFGMKESMYKAGIKYLRNISVCPVVREIWAVLRAVVSCDGYKFRYRVTFVLSYYFVPKFTTFDIFDLH